MAAKVDAADVKCFWKCVEDCNTGPIVHSNTVGDASGPKEIAQYVAAVLQEFI